MRIAYPDASVGAIHEDDIAAVAAKILVDGTHQGEALALTGPEPISLREQVRTIGEALGRPLGVTELTPAEARETMGGPRGIPAPIVDVLLRSSARAVGRAAPVTGAVEAVTGAAPRDFRQWATDHRADFS